MQLYKWANKYGKFIEYNITFKVNKEPIIVL